jgi:hypothetical protein
MTKSKKEDETVLQVVWVGPDGKKELGPQFEFLVREKDRVADDGY